MKFKHVQRLSVLLAFLVIGFAGCKDGDPGINGTNGATGTNGTNGANGTTGPGYAEAIKNGYIIFYLNGTRPDGVPFTDTLNFLFSSSNLSYSNANPGSPNSYFETRRYQAMDNYTSKDNYADMYLDVDNVEDVNQFRIYCTLKASIAGPDFKYFDLNESYYNNDDVNILNPSFTSYSYTPSTGRLIYNFSFTVSPGSNGTGNTLNVSGKVNAIVYVTNSGG